MKRDCYESPSCMVTRVCPETGFAGSGSGSEDPQAKYFDIFQGEDDKEFS